MQPGDAVAFHYRTLHGARGNFTDRRRRAFSLRFVGDDARAMACARAAPRRPSRATECSQASACAKTGSRSCGTEPAHGAGDGAAAE